MFNKHLEDHGIWYFDHLKLAFFIGKESMVISLMAFVHWLLPMLFQTTASQRHAALMPEYQKRLKVAQLKHQKV